MAQWAKLFDVYKKKAEICKHITVIFSCVKFPFEVRDKYANWIEAQPWHELNMDSEEDCEKAKGLFAELVGFLERDMNSATFCDRMRMEEQKTKLKDLATPHVSDFVQAVRQFLKEELILIQSALCSDEDVARRCKNNLEQAEKNRWLEQRIEQLDEKIRNADTEVQAMRMKQDQMIVNHEELVGTLKRLEEEIEKPTNGTRVDSLKKALGQRKQELANKWNENFARREAVKNTYLQVATDLTTVLKQIWAEVEKWKHLKKLYITGLDKPKEGAVEILNELCEDGGRMLMTVIQGVQNIIHTYQAFHYQDDPNEQIMATMLKELEGDYLNEHLKRVFVVDRNPQQVLKVTSGRTLGFSMSVRILGGNALALQMRPPKVTAKLFHERNLEEATKNPMNEEGVCNVVNGKDRTMEYMHKGNKTGQWVCNFNSVLLNKVRRVQDKSQDELVTEHKYGMIFFTEVKIRERTIPLQVLSLPLVLTSQTSQECMAKGTLIWDSAFSPENRQPYADPNEVEWGSVGAVLNALFSVHTGRGLTGEHLRYLARVAFRDKDKDLNKDYNKMKISKAKLIKDKLPHRDFSFWKWFICCLNLIKAHLQKEWKESLIYGFLSKDEAVAKLAREQYGTFLLRFSESDIENSQRADICGYLTVAVIEMNPETACPKVYYVKEHLAPKDLHEKGLAAILEAFQVIDPNTQGKKRLLTTLWPGKDFFLVFQPYLTQKAKEDDGYKRGKFRIEIELGNAVHGTNGGNTPTHVMSPLSPGMSSVTSPMMDVLPTTPLGTEVGTDDSNLGLFPQSPFQAQASPPIAQVAPMPANAAGAYSAQHTPQDFVQGLPPVGANVTVERVINAEVDDGDNPAADELAELMNGNPQALADMMHSIMIMNNSDQ